MKQKFTKPEIKFLEDCLLINQKILVITDLHIGYEEYLCKESLIQRTQLKEILEKLNNVFETLKKEKITIEKVIILGDLKNEFGEISDAEWRETLILIDYLIEKIKTKGKIILIKGNHDNILGPIAKKREIKLKNYYKIKNICFLHGDKICKNYLKNTDILILGHLHPSITLSDDYKREKYKCFLKGVWKNKEVYVLPSLSQITFGYELKLLNEENSKDFFIIPPKKLKNFRVIIYNNKENKKYDFGELKNLI
jgi:putative SbcD/Mre11-related phosphoesterase